MQPSETKTLCYKNDVTVCSSGPVFGPEGLKSAAPHNQCASHIDPMLPVYGPGRLAICLVFSANPYTSRLLILMNCVNPPSLHFVRCTLSQKIPRTRYRNISLLQETWTWEKRSQPSSALDECSTALTPPFTQAYKPAAAFV
jgi:hypothetical protein